MKIRTIAIVAPLVVGLSFSAAAKDCDYWQHDGPSFQIGEAMLGSKVRVGDLPVDWTPGEQCWIDKENNHFDCEFTDSNGIAYLVVGDEIIRKELKGEDIKAFGALPFGLSLPLSIDKIVRSQILRSADFPPMEITFLPNGGATVVTDYCVMNGNGTAYSLEFEIDKIGAFVKMSARILWE